MYLDYYGLQREPFNITPDPDFLFLNESHKEALASIVYGIEKRKGFIAITGGIGLGKTTIVRAYLESKDDGHLKIIYVFNANISFKGLLKTIYQELELEDDNLDIFETVNRLHLTLISEYEAGNNIVLIIDEAQNMPVETLENLRMLSNLETSTDKLIQIVFIGQPEFDSLISRPELRQLRQRIAMRTVIHPLNNRESVEYITHRLNRGGLKGELPFTIPALQAIVKGAKGVPRTINIICDNALIAGFGCDQRPVGLKIVKEILSDFGGRTKSPIKWSYIAAAAIALAILAAFLFLPYKSLSFEWAREILLLSASKPHAVRIPIKSEIDLLGPPLQGETKAASDSAPDMGANAREQQAKPQARPDALAASTAESVKPSGAPLRKASQRTRTIVSYPSESASISSSEGNGENTRKGVKQDGEIKTTIPPHVDMIKDVDNRLLELIRQPGPVAASANTDEKLPPNTIEQLPAEDKVKQRQN